MPELLLNKSCIKVLRVEEDNLFHISHPDESVMEAPHPSIVWYLVDGLTVIVSGFDPLSVLNVSEGCDANNCDWSGVVIQTLTVGPAAPMLLSGRTKLPMINAARMENTLTLNICFMTKNSLLFTG